MRAVLACFLWLAAGASVVLSYCVKGPSAPFLLDIRRGIVGRPVAFPALVGGLPIRQAVSGGIFAVIYEIFTFF